ncbi:aminotransferase class V-fold PLP-dependent enzyme [Candidatus Saccharibacteria bacterium]|nr:aminotransferase class V-fold PLP-dependent enzyme [Candidatus Saccharibacteria bacterium]
MSEIAKLRAEFPQINDEVAYLDNAATTFKPRVVLAAVEQFYREQNANVHRGIYDLSSEATQRYEAVRQKVRDFVGADDSYAVIFTLNCTAALNLVARGLEHKLTRVLVSDYEHHSNLLPWGHVAEVESFDFGNYAAVIARNTAELLAVTAWSNILGKNTELAAILAAAKERRMITVVDAAQWVAHQDVDMCNIDCLAFSAHKMYGPMGLGVLVARKDLLAQMSPQNWGGEMVDFVHSATDYGLTVIPQRFEAGTPNVGGVLGLGAAIDWLRAQNRQQIFAYEQTLYCKARTQLAKIPGLQLLPGKDIICFTLQDVHPHDVAQLLNDDGICVRAGFHCAQPLLEKLGCGPVTRVSLACYNTGQEILRLCDALAQIRQKMGLKNV